MKTETIPAPAVRSGEGKLRVLLAGRDSGEVELHLQTLFPQTAGNLELTAVSSLATLLPTIPLVSPQIVFLDLALFGSDPLEGVRKVRRILPNVPLITLGSSGQREVAERSLQAGATDYLLKGFIDLRTFERTLRIALQRNSPESHSNDLRDPLTGLLNCDGFASVAARSLQAAERSGGRLILLSAELENLKEIRDELGSIAGDTACRELAQLLHGSFRRSDLVARTSDSEFLVLAADAGEPSSQVLRARVDARLAARNVCRGRLPRLRVHLDVYSWAARSGVPFDYLLHTITRMNPAPHGSAQGESP